MLKLNKKNEIIIIFVIFFLSIKKIPMGNSGFLGELRSNKSNTAKFNMLSGFLFMISYIYF